MGRMTRARRGVAAALLAAGLAVTGGAVTAAPAQAADNEGYSWVSGTGWNDCNTRLNTAINNLTRQGYVITDRSQCAQRWLWSDEYMGGYGWRAPKRVG